MKSTTASPYQLPPIEDAKRQYVEGYLRIPVDDETIKWAKLERCPLDDDVDWAALYEIER